MKVRLAPGAGRSCAWRSAGTALSQRTPLPAPGPDPQVYYWDSYLIIEGLLASNLTTLAQAGAALRCWHQKGVGVRGHAAASLTHVPLVVVSSITIQVPPAC